MYELTLQDLGLSPNESRIYEALLELGEASVSDVATQTSIHRRNVYDAVNRLVEKGFIVPVIDSKEKKYVPVEPNKFLEVVEEKRSKLQQILPDMQEIFERKRAKEGVYIYKGVEGSKNVIRDMLNVGKTVYTIGGKGVWANPPSLAVSKWILTEARRKQIKFYTLFDSSNKGKILENIKAGKQTDIITYRFLPKKYSSAAAIDIYEDRVAVFTGKTLDTIEEGQTIFMMKSQNLADSYRQWFQFMWDRCAAK